MNGIIKIKKRQLECLLTTNKNIENKIVFLKVEDDTDHDYCICTIEYNEAGQLLELGQNFKRFNCFVYVSYSIQQLTAHLKEVCKKFKISYL